MSEHREQVTVVQWLRAAEIETPEYALVYAVPNGGKRAPITARKMVAEGLKRGVPDLVWPVRRGRFSGLYVEMKKAGGKVGPEQKAWRDALMMQGYAVYVAIGASAAVEVLRQFNALSIPSDLAVEAARRLIEARNEAERRKELAKWRKKQRRAA